MKKTFSFVAISAFCLLLLACSSKEQSTINDMASLAEEVENASDPESLDWNELNKEYEAIVKSADECHFSNEESREYYRQQGKFQAALVKYAVKSVPGIIDKVTNDASGYLDGLMEGIDDSDE